MPNFSLCLTPTEKDKLATHSRAVFQKTSICKSRTGKGKGRITGSKRGEYMEIDRNPKSISSNRKGGRVKAEKRKAALNQDKKRSAKKNHLSGRKSGVEGKMG